MAQMTFAQATMFFGTRQAVRLITLKSRMDDEGGAEAYESGNAHKRNTDAKLRPGNQRQRNVELS